MSSLVPAHRQKVKKIQKQAKIHSILSALYLKYRSCLKVLCFCFIHFKASPDLWGQKFCQHYWSVLLSRSELASTTFFIWYCTLLYGIAHYCMVLYDIVWSELANTTFFTSASLNLLLHGIAFYHMILHGIIWYCMLL